MKRIQFILTVLVLSAFFACQPSEQKLEYNKVKKLESIVFNDSVTGLNPKDVTNLIVAYTNYTRKFPEDTVCPTMLFEAGRLAMNINLSSQAISNFSKIQRDYPNSSKYPYAIFLQAFVYDTQLQNYEKAGEFYRKFIAEFPDHELADDAQASIDNLGKSLDEIIKSFEQKGEEEK